MIPRMAGAVLGILVLLPNARGDENRVAHVLIVADTVDRSVGRITATDGLIFGYLVKNSIPRDRLSLHVLHGAQATPYHIARYYENLTVGPRDAVVLFYSGHGGWDPVRGHVLTLNAGHVLRKDLLRVMTVKRGRLTVLLTNCCSNWISTPAFGRDEDGDGGVPAGGFSPALRCLLFCHQGVVDITAAKPGTYAFGSSEGGWFTLALSRVLQAPPDRLDVNRDGFVSWEEVFGLVRQQTRDIFNDYASGKVRRVQDTQEPVASSLGRRLGDAAVRIPTRTPVARRAHRHVAVTVRNPTGVIIFYQLRWGPRGAVKSFLLPPNCQVRHTHTLDEDGAAPTPQICYACGLLEDRLGDLEVYNLHTRAVDFANRRDLGKPYHFIVLNQGFRYVVKLSDSEPRRKGP